MPLVVYNAVTTMNVTPLLALTANSDHPELVFANILLIKNVDFK